MRRSNYSAGMRAEFWARVYLRLKFYRILKTRWRTPAGEIDILAVRGKTIVIMEVKHRATIEDALQCLRTNQQQKLSRAMNHVIAAYPRYNTHYWRHDLIAMAPNYLPRHIVNAWQNG